MTRYYSRKIDANQPEIVDTLRKLGCSVWPLNDVVDLLVGYGGYTRLVEVRLPGQKPKPREGRQKKFHDEWTGGVYWIQTLEDAHECVKSMRKHVELIRDGFVIPF